jgi:uridine phosphorylase
MSGLGSASHPEHNGGAYHLGIRPGDLPPYVLLPGDVDRVEKIAATWEEAKPVAKRRQFASYTGIYKGVRLGVVSTGIGGPAVTIAVEELADAGVHTFIRVGSSGSVREDVRVGEVVITKAAARFDGASSVYAPAGYPASSDPDVFSALVKAAKGLGVSYHKGITASFDAFYVAQGRPGHGGFLPREKRAWLEDMRALNITNIEMEAATLLTMTNVYGLRGGVVCAVFADRLRDEFGERGEAQAISVANEAVKILYSEDERE